MTARAAVACGLFALTLAATTVAACSGDATIGPSKPVDSDGSAPIPSEASGPDAASITPRPDLCEGLAPGGNAVPELALPGLMPPPLGGVVMAGTYDLAELDVYTGAEPDAGPDAGNDDSPSTELTGRAAQITIVVDEFDLRTAAARGTSDDGGLSTEPTNAVLYRVDGTSLVVTAVCPTTALPVSMPFSAVGGGLALFVDATHRELFVRR